MTAALVVLSVFLGTALVIATIGGLIMLADGKITLPRTNARRLQRERTETAILEFRLEQERTRTMLDAQIEMRYKNALPRGTSE
jgi:hypothetical protein